MKMLHILRIIGICVLLFSTSLPLFAANQKSACKGKVPKPAMEREKEHTQTKNRPAPFITDTVSIGTTPRVDLGIQSPEGSQAYVFIEGNMLEKSSEGIGIGFTFPLKHIKNAAKKMVIGTQKVFGYAKNVGSRVIRVVKGCWFW